MSGPFQICHPTPNDREAIEAIASSAGLHVDVEAELERNWARLWVARTTDSAVLSAFLLAWKVADEFELLALATHPDFQRQGAARALVSTLLAHAESAAARLISLEVRQNNDPALRLYQACGFSVAGVRPRYYSDTGEDALILELRFDTPLTPEVFA